MNKIFGLFAALVLLLVGCSSGEQKTKPEAGKYPLVIPATTKVADPDTRLALSSFDPSSGVMRFSQSTPELENLKAGDILVGEPSKAAPYGYLRKVSAIAREGSAVVVQTTEAKLNEAVQSGSLNAEYVKLEPSQMLGFQPSRPGVTSKIVNAKGQEVRDVGAQFEIGDGLFYQLGVDRTLCPTDDCSKMSVALKGNIRFNAGYKVGVDIGFFSIDRFEAKIGIDEVIEAGLVAKVNNKVQLGQVKSYELGRYPYGIITFWIGPIPVVVQPILVVNVRIDGSAEVDFSWGIRQTLGYTIGTLYDGDKWHDISQEGYNFTPNLLPNIRGAAKIKFLYELEPFLKFYGSAGPYFAIAAGLSVDAAHPRTPSWILGGAIQCRAGVRADFKMFGSLDYGGQVCNKTFEIARQPNRPPVITQVPQGNPQVVAVKGAQLFLNGNPASFSSGSLQIKADDPEDGEDLSFTATSDRDGAFTQVGDLYKLTPKSLGIHNIRVTVTDSGGLSATSSFQVNVTAGKPSVDAVIPNRTLVAGTEVSLSYSGQNGDSVEIAPPPLTCNQMAWSVSSPDEILRQSTSSSQTQCAATLRFNTPGTRLITLNGTDNWGQTTSKSFALTIQAPGPVAVNYLKVSCNNLEVPEGTNCYGKKVLAWAKVTGPQGSTLSYSWMLESDQASAPKIALQDDITVPPADATTSVTLPRKLNVVVINPDICGLTPDSTHYYNTLTLTATDSVNTSSQSFRVACSVLK